MEKTAVQSVENMGNRLEFIMMKGMQEDDTQKGICNSLIKRLFKEDEEKKTCNMIINLSLFKKELAKEVESYLSNEEIWMSYPYNDKLLRRIAKKHGVEQLIPDSLSIWVSYRKCTIRIGELTYKN